MGNQLKHWSCFTPGEVGLAPAPPGVQVPGAEEPEAGREPRLPVPFLAGPKTSASCLCHSGYTCDFSASALSGLDHCWPRPYGIHIESEDRSCC
jgi:hypothetical protein